MIEFIEKENYKDLKGIYGIRNKINQKIYVGQTKQTFYKRYCLHDWQLRNNKHENPYLQKAYNKYSESNFEFIVIESIIDCSDEQLDQMEIQYINFYKEKNLAYNILMGGNTSRRGIPMSEEAKRKVGEKNRIHNLGKKASEETKRKMSKASKGKHRDKKTQVITVDIARQAKQLLLSGMSPKEVSNKLNVPYRVINNIYSNNAWSTIFVEGWEDFYKNRIVKHRLKHSDHDEMYRLYCIENMSVKEIAKKYNRSTALVNAVLKKHQKIS